MKVALVTSWKEKCGISTYSEFLSDSLKAKGIKVDIFKVPLDKLRINPREYIEIAKKIQGYDIVHVQYEHGLYGLFGLCAPIFYSIIRRNNPIVVSTIHEIYPINRGLKNHLKDLLVLRKVVNLSDAIITHSKSSAHYIEKINPSKKIFVIHHGIKMLKCNKKIARKALNLSLKKRIIVIPGFVRENKQYEKIIENSPDDCMIIAAGGPQNDKDKKYAQQLKNIHITGFLSHNLLEKYICSADLIVLYYSGVTFSGVLSLAMGMNKKIITSKLEPFKEIASYYPNIYFADDQNLRRVIKHCLNSKEKGSQKISEFSWECVSIKHIELYNKLWGS